MLFTQRRSLEILRTSPLRRSKKFVYSRHLLAHRGGSLQSSKRADSVRASQAIVRSRVRNCRKGEFLRSSERCM